MALTAFVNGGPTCSVKHGGSSVLSFYLHDDKTREPQLLTGWSVEFRIVLPNANVFAKAAPTSGNVNAGKVAVALTPTESATLRAAADVYQSVQLKLTHTDGTILFVDLPNCLEVLPKLL